METQAEILKMIEEELHETKELITEADEQEYDGPDYFVPTTASQAKEKKAIRDRLIEYRHKNGLGCFNRLAQLSNGAVTVCDMRNILTGGDQKLSLNRWMAIGAALDLDEEEKNGKL